MEGSEIDMENLNRYKFRAWDKGKRVFLPEDSFAVLNGQDQLFVMVKDFENYMEGEYGYPDSYELVQSTGLKDKNGKEIYEGYILDYTIFDHNDNDTQFKGEVKFVGTEYIVTQVPDRHCNGEFGINLGWVHYQDCELEIIGNIYENPELLSNEEIA